MPETKIRDLIQVLDNGPLHVSGGTGILDGEGKAIKVEQDCYLCRCGLTGNAPYCNGSHEGKFESKIRS